MKNSLNPKMKSINILAFRDGQDVGQTNLVFLDQFCSIYYQKEKIKLEYVKEGMGGRHNEVLVEVRLSELEQQRIITHIHNKINDFIKSNDLVLELNINKTLSECM